LECTFRGYVVVAGFVSSLLLSALLSPISNFVRIAALFTVLCAISSVSVFVYTGLYCIHFHLQVCLIYSLVDPVRTANGQYAQVRPVAVDLVVCTSKFVPVFFFTTFFGKEDEQMNVCGLVRRLQIFAETARQCSNQRSSVGFCLELGIRTPLPIEIAPSSIAELCSNARLMLGRPIEEIVI
jgi:hypothetical protein